MSTSSAGGDIDVGVCWEQIERAGHPFRFTKVFAGNDHSDRLLSVFALCAAVERLVSESTDLDVAQRKLEWWRFQCLQQQLQSSKHPVIRCLVASGAGDQLDPDDLTGLFDQAEKRLDARPLTDIDELRKECIQISRPQAALSAVVNEKGSSVEYSAAGLAQLIRESRGPAGENRFWWVPMNLLARHGLARTDLVEESQINSVKRLFDELIDSVTSQPQRMEPLMENQQHFALVNHLNRCQLQRIKGSEPSFSPEELNRMRMADFVSAWLLARKLKRAALRARP